MKALLAQGYAPNAIAVEQDMFDLLIVAGVVVPAGAVQSAASQAQQNAAVPVAIKGPWDNLSYRPQLDGLLKQPGKALMSTQNKKGGAEAPPFRLLTPVSGLVSL